MADTLATLIVVAFWFVLNIAMGSSTKWIFMYGKICVEGTQECETFKFPLLITVIHMLFSWGMCYIQLTWISKKPNAKTLTLREQFYKVAPLSVCFSLAVGMGNLSLKYIYPSFNQMLGSMSPLITVGLAVLMQKKEFNWWTWGSMPIICGGLAICSIKEVTFHALGAFFATSATLLRAMKTIIQGRLLQGEKLDSVTLLCYMAPWAAFVLFIVACCTEGIQPLILMSEALTGKNAAGQTITGGWTVLGLLIVSGLNACLLNVANFMVTSHTSAVTLQVLGNVKNCCSIAVSIAIFGNALQPVQVAGVATCLCGVYLYNKKGAEIRKNA